MQPARRRGRKPSHNLALVFCFAARDFNHFIHETIIPRALGKIKYFASPIEFFNFRLVFLAKPGTWITFAANIEKSAKIEPPSSFRALLKRKNRKKSINRSWSIDKLCNKDYDINITEAFANRGETEMKKKLLIVMLALIVAIVAAFALTACGETNGDGGNNGGSGDNTDNSTVVTPGGDTDNSGDNTEQHTHSFTAEVVSDKYLASRATCTEKAKYYYSCECGEKGTKTFEYGEVSSEHPFGDGWEHDNASHYRQSTCEHKIVKDKAAHSYNGERVCSVCGYTSTKPIGTEIQSDVFTIDKENATMYLKVPNAVTEYDFNGKFEIADGATYGVYRKKDGSGKILSRRTDINAGDNIFYIIVENGNDLANYTLTLRRREIYTVSFATNGGTAVTPQQIEEDDFATVPSATMRVGYNFKSWDYDFTMPITGNTTVTASWSIISYKITYNLNGGKVSGANPTTYTVEDSITLLNPQKDYYDFTGWNDNGKIAKGSIGDKVFTATFTPTVYKISYNLNGGKVSGANPTTYTVEDSITLLNPQKDYYDFTGWSDDGRIEKGSHGDKTFTAEYIPIVYKISYNLNGGKVSGTNPTTYTVESETITLSTVASKDYYDFTGWSDGGKIVKGSHGDKIFTAKYTPTIYRINYNCGEGDKGANKATYTIESEMITLSDGYYINADFVEWRKGDKKITQIPKGSHGDITLTAVWNMYDVTLELSSDGKSYTVTGKNVNEMNIVVKPAYKGIPVTEIGTRAFEKCSRLTSITIPSSVTSIGGYAFYDCSRLTSITIPSSVTSIGSSAFSGCSWLTSITIPSSVTSIGSSAFSGCRSVTSITIPNSVTSIGGYAINSERDFRKTQQKISNNIENSLQMIA